MRDIIYLITSLTAAHATTVTPSHVGDWIRGPIQGRSPSRDATEEARHSSAVNLMMYVSSLERGSRLIITLPREMRDLAPSLPWAQGMVFPISIATPGAYRQVLSSRLRLLEMCR